KGAQTDEEYGAIPETTPQPANRRDEGRPGNHIGRDHPLCFIEAEAEGGHHLRQRHVDRGVIHHHQEGAQRDSSCDPPLVRRPVWSNNRTSPSRGKRWYREQGSSVLGCCEALGCHVGSSMTPWCQTVMRVAPRPVYCLRTRRCVIGDMLDP